MALEPASGPSREQGSGAAGGNASGPAPGRWWLVLLALLLLFSAWIRWQHVSFRSFDPRPFPDALEYTASAVSLAEGRGLVMPIGSGVYPPRYPYGFPALLAGAHLAGLPELRFHLVNFVLGLLLVLIVHALSRRAGAGPGAALFAAAIVATSPQLIHLSFRVLSDLAYLNVVMLIFLLLPAGPPAEGRVVKTRLFLAGAAAGFSVALRVVGVILLPVLLAAAVWPQRRGRRFPPLAAVLPVIAGCAVCLVPQLLFNQANFGDPLATGYSYWIEQYGSATELFGPQFVAGREYPTFGNLHYYATLLGGMIFDGPEQQLYAPAVFLLAAAGLLLLARRARLRGLHAAGAAMLLVQLVFLQFYYGAQVRLIIVAIPWAALWAAEGLQLAWHRPAGARWRRTVRAAALLACAAVLLPPLGFGVAGAPASERWGEGGMPYSQWLLQATPGSALIVGNMSPVVAELRLQGRGGREWIQLSDNDGRHVFRFQLRGWRGDGPPLPQARFARTTPEPRDVLRPLFRAGRNVRLFVGLERRDGRTEPLFTTDRWRLEQVRTALARGRPVYLVLRPDGRLSEQLLAKMMLVFDLAPAERMRGVRLFRVEALKRRPRGAAGPGRPAGRAGPRAESR